MDYKGSAWFLTTPRGRDYLWELWQKGQRNKARLERNPDYKPQNKEERSDSRWWSWQMPSHTNPHIPPSELRDMEDELPATVFSQEVLAEFLEVGGRFFDEWLPERLIKMEGRDGKLKDVKEEWHVITPFTVPTDWVWTGGLDYGKAAPFSFHPIATDPNGDQFIVDEVYQAGLTPAQQADLTVKCLERNNVPKNKQGNFLCTIYADPSMFPPKNEKDRVGEYPIEAFWARGLTCVKAKNDRVSSNAALLEWMHATRKYMRQDPISGLIEEDVMPRLRVFRGRCANFIRTVPLMIRDEKNPEDFDTTLEDHAVDSGGRYGIGSSRPRVPKPKDAEVGMTQEQLQARHALGMDTAGKPPARPDRVPGQGNRTKPVYGN